MDNEKRIFLIGLFPLILAFLATIGFLIYMGYEKSINEPEPLADTARWQGTIQPIGGSPILFWFDSYQKDGKTWALYARSGRIVATVEVPDNAVFIIERNSQALPALAEE